MKLQQIGTVGEDVRKWQYFLAGQQLYDGIADGQFGENTFKATVLFQKQNGLEPDGIVGNKTYGKAMILGYGGVIDLRTDISGENFPAKPSFNVLGSNAAKFEVFGKFSYRKDPNRKGGIIIEGNWESQNLKVVSIPELAGIGPYNTTKVYFHKLGERQLKKLFRDWSNAGLLNKILTYEGSFDPRFIRSRKKDLSSHAFGIAFDINFTWNQLGAVPALVGQKGSVRELVKIANDNGFYWGGHFKRLDGMHFEIAELQ